MNTLDVPVKSVERVARTYRPILASKDGALPSQIQLLKAGIWDTPNHGIFAVTQEDLNQYKANFDAGVAQVIGGGTPDGVMIDYEHQPGVAAGWIKAVAVEGDTLVGTVEWSGQGKRDLIEGNYKYISPEFYPASRGGWEDPEQYGFYIPNVLAAAGLVNRPLFKGLKPIMASANAGDEGEDQDRNVIFISENKELPMPTLEEVRAKNAEDLTEADKELLTANKDQLTADEATKFGFEAPVVVENNENKEENKETETVPEVKTDPELAAVAASIKSGESVVIKASQLKHFEETAKQVDEMRKEKIAAGVQKHVARGAIKADQAGAWSDRIAADSGVEELLSNLPDNAVLAGEVGSSTKAKTASTAQEEVVAAAAKLRESDATLTEAQAINKVMASNSDLAKRYDAELRGN